MNSKTVFLMFAIAWIATAAAVIAAMYFTHKASALWAFIFPAMINFKWHDDNEEVNNGL